MKVLVLSFHYSGYFNFLVLSLNYFTFVTTQVRFNAFKLIGLAQVKVTMFHVVLTEDLHKLMPLFFPFTWQLQNQDLGEQVHAVVKFCHVAKGLYCYLVFAHCCCSPLFPPQACRPTQFLVPEWLPSCGNL